MITLTIEKAKNYFMDIMISGYNDRLNIEYEPNYFSCLSLDKIIEWYKEIKNISDNDDIKIIDYYTIQTSGKYKTMEELKQAMENYRRSLQNA